ncbi:MAG: VCBS repeat-containing protein [Polyangia bacterium]
MRNAVTAIVTLVLAAAVACSTRTPIGGIGAADGGIHTGGTGLPTGGTGTGGSGTGGWDFFTTGGVGTGGDGTGGAPSTGGSNFNTGGGGVAQVCPTAVGGAGGQSPNAPAFQPAANYRMLGYPLAIAIADVNGDSRPDLAVATYLPAATGGVSGNGSGTGGAQTGGAGAYIREGGNVSVLLNGGSGTFGTPTNHPVITPASVAAGELSGDGKADLAVAASEIGSVDVLTNTGTGTFGESVTYSVGIHPSAVAVGDLNGDGKMDIAVANSGQTNTGLGAGAGDVAVLLNAGGGNFVAANYLAGSNPAAIAIADLNGDGKGDLAVANPAGGATVLLNAGDGTFGAPAKYAAGSTPYSVAIGDLNGDGKPDIALASSTSGGGVAVLLNLGTGKFGAAIVYASGTFPRGIAIGDLNGDGFPDIATAYSLPDCNGVSVLVNKGTGTFGAPIPYPLAGSPSSLALADLNGDGKADLVVVSDEQVSVLINAR